MFCEIKSFFMKMTNHVSFTILTFLKSSWEIDTASNVFFYLKEDKVFYFKELPFRYVASFSAMYLYTLSVCLYAMSLPNFRNSVES